MAQSQVELYNIALGACGARSSVSAPTENSREAQICNLWYNAVRRQVFRAFHWNSLEAFARLALVKERDPDADWVATDPTPGWTYIYSAPNNMVAARYLTTFQRFRVAPYFATNIVGINTDAEDAVMCFTRDVTDVSLWDASLYMAMGYALAGHICMPLSAKPSRSVDLISNANAIITDARLQSANEKSDRLETMPDWIRARGYTGASGSDRYFEPYGDFITLTGAPVV